MKNSFVATLLPFRDFNHFALDRSIIFAQYYLSVGERIVGCERLISFLSAMKMKFLSYQ